MRRTLVFVRKVQTFSIQRNMTVSVMMEHPKQENIGTWKPVNRVKTFQNFMLDSHISKVLEETEYRYTAAALLFPAAGFPVCH